MKKRKETNSIGLVADLDKLNQKYFSLAGEIFENREMLSLELLGFMKEVIFEQYALEYRMLAAEGKAEPERKIFAADLDYFYRALSRKKSIFPWRRKWNYAARQLIQEAEERANAFFKACDRTPGEDAEEEETSQPGRATAHDP